MEYPGDSIDPAFAAEAPQGAAATIVVCDSCRFEGEPGTEPRPGAVFARMTAEAARSSDIEVRQVTCLGNCRHSLSAALIRKDSWGYVFGGLGFADAVHLVAAAELFTTSTDGRLPYRGRPEALKGALVARIPLLEFTKDIA